VDRPHRLIVLKAWADPARRIRNLGSLQMVIMIVISSVFGRVISSLDVFCCTGAAFCIFISCIFASEREGVVFQILILQGFPL
jgi:hypothetical protein